MDDVAASGLHPHLDTVVTAYREAFARKCFPDPNLETDPVMDAFGIDPTVKLANRQYWGSELGKVWEKLVAMACTHADTSTRTPSIGDRSHPCDIVFRGFGIDTKYRIGSGDNPFKTNLAVNGRTLLSTGLKPVLLICRDDNLHAPLKCATSAGWTVVTGKAAFEFIRSEIGFDMTAYLRAKSAELAA